MICIYIYILLYTVYTIFIYITITIRWPLFACQSQQIPSHKRKYIYIYITQQTPVISSIACRLITNQENNMYIHVIHKYIYTHQHLYVHNVELFRYIGTEIVVVLHITVLLRVRLVKVKDIVRCIWASCGKFDTIKGSILCVDNGQQKAFFVWCVSHIFH